MPGAPSRQDGRFDDLNMTAPVTPDPGPDWYSAYLRSALRAAEPADATAVRPRPTPASLRDYLRALRQAAGGLAEGGANLAADLVHTPAMFASEGPTLQTVGRGQVRTANAPTAGQEIKSFTDALAHPLEQGAAAIGDVVAGGVPQNVSDQSFRSAGYLPGNLLTWAGAGRVPALLRRLRANPEPYAERLRRGLELADAAHPAPKPVVAPPTAVPVNPVMKLPSEMTPAEQRVNKAVGDLKALALKQAKGVAVYPEEQAARQALYDQALRELGIAPIPGPAAKQALYDDTLRKLGAAPAKPRLRAAWRTKDGKWFPGTDHGDAANVAAAAGYGPETLVEDGFVTPAGKFLTRDEALKRHNVSVSSDINAAPVAQVFGREEAPWFKLISEELPPGPAAPVTQGPGYFPGLQKILKDQRGALGPLYHGSPHKFDAFDITKTGTGEGAAAYGHGLYFAENPGVAQSYRDRLAGEPEILNLRVGGRSVGPKNGFDYSPRLTGNSPAALEDNIGSQLIEQLLIDQAELVGVGPKGVQEHTLKVLDDITKNYANEWPEAVDAVKSLRAKLARPGGVSLKVNQPEGAMYKVEAPNIEPEHLLDWDAPFAEQPPRVRTAVASLLGTEPPANMTGEEVYNLLGGGFSASNKRLSINGQPAHAYLSGVMLPEASGGTAGFPQHARDIAVGLLHKSEGDIPAALQLLENAPEYRQATDLRAGVRQVLEHARQQNVQYLRSPFVGPQAVSRELNKAGVPGLRYFDQGSRDAGQGTRNYVLFDDKGLNIIDRQGNTGLKMLLGMTGAGAAALSVPALIRSLTGSKQ
jgi:hypothetical protein